MKNLLIIFKSTALKMAFATLIVFAASLFQINAQTAQNLKEGKREIPIEFISTTKFLVIKSANPTLSFTDSTPYFTELNIVDEFTRPLQSVVAININDAKDEIVRREFNFSAVAPGNYYAQGMLTGTMVYYPVEVKE